jgi:adenosylcobyric acid synthase
VAPFKAQNMSLNSFVTPDGGEIGRAQALQAEACGILPHVDMNPILLKPESDACSQVVILGKVFAKQEAATYFDGQRTLWPVVKDSYARLESQYDVIVIEGAGSAAEVNLWKHDLVNWPVVTLADARVLLVANIDRGGVFAQVLGTLDLLEPNERARVCGVIINKFRGDASLFAEGVKFLESRSRVPVLGVVPFLHHLMLDQEDSLDKAHQRADFAPNRINISVIVLPHMSNFTDFNVLGAEEDVVVKYATAPSALLNADVVIIPGTKNTLADLSYLREKGYVPALDDHVQSRRELVGICGGYQMLGRQIADPHGVEQGGTSHGLGYLNIKTELTKTKYTMQVEAHTTNVLVSDESLIRGYQIHMGITLRVNEQPCFRIARPLTREQDAHLQAATHEEMFDGAIRNDGRVWGTYIHGVFDEPDFRRIWLNRARARKRLPPLDTQSSKAVTARLQGELDRWAAHLSLNLNLSHLLGSLYPTNPLTK